VPSAALAQEETVGKASFARKASAVLLGVIGISALAPDAWADEPKLSISGYDPVAYFTDGRPVQGKSEFEYLWHKLRWRFSSADHRDLFSKDPQHYAPQYDGYCSMGASLDGAAHKDIADPESWAIVDGKLYLVGNQYWLGQWRAHAKELIQRADASWHAIEDLPGPRIIGPPCAASPPTTEVALRDGGHWLVIAGQVPRDEAGNVVGKGDMRAQIEQVGRNVGACLKAANVGVGDIAFTVSQVIDPAELERYSDLLTRYFGPPSPKSTTVRAPQLSDPNYLLEVQAIAAVN
jgi:enamine deaminase RidA (YjgF/YER057c/UK114 family)